MRRQRSLQKGNSLSLSESVGFLQIGQSNSICDVHLACVRPQGGYRAIHVRIGNGRAGAATSKRAALSGRISVARPIKS